MQEIYPHTLKNLHWDGAGFNNAQQNVAFSSETLETT